MAASVNWYDTDDTTPLDAVDLGAIPPGQDYFTRNGAYLETRVKNDGTENFASVDVEIQQAGSFAAYQYLRIAQGAGSPGAFQDHTANPLSLGALAQGISASVWLDFITPGGATPESGQVTNLVVLASL